PRLFLVAPSVEDFYSFFFASSRHVLLQSGRLRGRTPSDRWCADGLRQPASLRGEWVSELRHEQSSSPVGGLPNHGQSDLARFIPATGAQSPDASGWSKAPCQSSTRSVISRKATRWRSNCVRGRRGL